MSKSKKRYWKKPPDFKHGIRFWVCMCRHKNWPKTVMVIQFSFPPPEQKKENFLQFQSKKSHFYLQFCKWTKNWSIIKRWLWPMPVNTGGTIAALLLHWESLCFSASPWFPACKCRLCDSWYYICVQRRSGRLTQVPFRINAPQTISRLQMNLMRGKIKMCIWMWRQICLCALKGSLVSRWVVTVKRTMQVLPTTSPSCPRLHSQALMGLCKELWAKAEVSRSGHMTPQVRVESD